MHLGNFSLLYMAKKINTFLPSGHTDSHIHINEHIMFLETIPLSYFSVNLRSSLSILIGRANVSTIQKA